jgi:hypothetical protein
MTVTLTPEQMPDELEWVKPYLDEAEQQIERGERISGDELLKWLDARITELKA